jgi:hypothetical protein
VSGEIAPPIVCVEVILTMVLDPLSAFSVTCNVLQVIEFSVKVLSKAADYRKAETGVLTEQKDLRDVPIGRAKREEATHQQRFY